MVTQTKLTKIVGGWAKMVLELNPPVTRLIVIT